LPKGKLAVAVITPWKVRCGIATYSESLAKALAELGVEVYIVRLVRFGTKSPEILQNVVDTIPIDKVDLVHVEHEYGLYQNLEGGFYGALKRLGKPILTTMHAIGVRWDVDQVIATTSDRVIVHNEFMARRLGHPCVIIPHGTKPSKCVEPDEAKRSLGIDPRVPIVGYQGFISSYKGLETLIEAMRGVPEAALLIGGGWHIEAETQYQMQLKQWSLEVLRGRCQWLGYVPDERLATVYGSMQIVVYPSRFITESGALLMALSHGKAVLASRLPPVREKEKLGALMTFRDVQDLRRKIRRLLRDEELRRRLEEGARAYAESVSWPRVAEKHISLYEDILK
jgi:glycosyltransferase involved in cell wall biosynthesis